MASPSFNQEHPLKLHFSWRFLLAFLLIFTTELLIALFVHDSFIRPFVGDVLVMVLMYCFVRIFLAGPVWLISGALLIFAFSIECAQGFKLVERLGLQDNAVARIIIGTTFDLKDLLAYTLGTALILLGSRLLIRDNEGSDFKKETPDA